MIVIESTSNSNYKKRSLAELYLVHKLKLDPNYTDKALHVLSGLIVDSDKLYRVHAGTGNWYQSASEYVGLPTLQDLEQMTGIEPVHQAGVWYHRPMKNIYWGTTKYEVLCRYALDNLECIRPFRK